MAPPPKKKTKKKTAKRPARRRLALSAIDSTVVSDCCQSSSLIISRAHQSASALLAAYDLARDQRGGRRGMTTDQEQDLLRSMLVMATAGLDSMSKQLIRDSLRVVINSSAQAQNTFEKFIERKLGDAKVAGDRTAANRFLARVLSKPSPQGQLVEEYIFDLTKGSLQSSSSLFQVAAALGVDPPSAGIDPDVLSPIFAIRNSIVHELDINLDAQRRNRHVRRQTSMINNTNTILRVSGAILRIVDAEAERGNP